MNKIKVFWIKYKKYLIIAIVVILILSLVGWLLLRNRNREKEVEVATDKLILAPFVKNNVIPDFSVSEFNESSYSKGSYIFDVSGYKESVTDIIQKFDRIIKQTLSTKEMNIWETGNGYAVYSPITGILEITPRKGREIPKRLTDKEDIIKFVQKDLGYSSTMEVVSNKDNSGYVYRGYYLIADEQFGSVSLNSYAFVIETDKEGEISRLRVLLYNPNSISVYSKYSFVPIGDLIKDKRIFVDRLSISENYNDKDIHIKASLSIQSLSIRKVQGVYQFSDYEHGYIFPAYVMSADAQMKDYKGGEYTADVLLYVMAIDPDLVTPKEDTLEGFLDPSPW